MEKKNLKWYDAPQTEVVEMEMQGILCASIIPPVGGGSTGSEGADPGLDA